MGTHDPVHHTKTPAKALETFKPRDTRLIAAQTAAHSRAVFVLRRFLPLLIFFMLIALVAWPMITVQQLSSIVTSALPNLVIENLRYSGLDAKNQPYTLTAARALQVQDLKNTIDLEQPQGDIALENGSWLAGAAQKGRYDQANKSLLLTGNVHIYHDLGYQFSTSRAEIDLNSSTANGDEPVLLQGSFGEIKGTGFHVSDKGNVIVIKGPATARLQLREGSPSGKKDKKNTVSPK